MANTNRSLRIHTSIDNDSSVHVHLNQTYDTFEILSLKLRSEGVYRLHSANYGVIVGRVLANENFGVPNAKISVFIESDFENDNDIISALYPYQTVTSTNNNNVRYNLLPDEKVSDCHQPVGTFPNKTFLLDNDDLIEVFDKYYVYTTRTNNAGDYIICGVPVGQQTLHMDLDLSDCGILSQKPRDFVYKGYTIEQFENPNQFKTSTELDSLSQIFTQNQTVNVIPFWGNEENGETIGITRADIKITFKFEPTCVFMGSLVADNASNGISKKCVPTNQMGAMDELTAGEGTIEMIRKTPGGNIEEFQVKGTELIDGNGVWCYQIPMNLDYMMTDEYGNMVPTDDPTKGVPTRTRVRFRVSMEDNEANTDNYFRAKVLVPHNPLNRVGGGHEDYDYEFGSNTREDSFRDLFWNNVYTVKSYIPRFQKPKNNVKTERFSGIKHCNIYGQNNPMPYNNIRIRLPLMFTILCALIKTYIRIVGFLNKVIYWLTRFLADILPKEKAETFVDNAQYVLLADGLCPDLDNWYFAPGANTKKRFVKDGVPEMADIPTNGNDNNIYLLEKTFETLTGNRTNVKKNRVVKESIIGIPTVVVTTTSQNSEEDKINITDDTSVDYANADDNSSVCLTVNIDYLESCIEMALAQEYRVINFDFYNDWINGVIYMPRWMRVVRKKRSFLWGLIKIKPKVKGCMDDTKIFNKTRYYVQQCALAYTKDENGIYTKNKTKNGCVSSTSTKQKCHTVKGLKRYPIFGGNKKTGTGNGGVVHEHETMLKENVYYFKPCEWGTNNRKVQLFANDIVLLGSLNDCSMYGIPQAFRYLKSSTYVMPTNLALTNMDEEGYLYTDDGTICNGNVFLEKSGVTQSLPTFSNVEKYYSGSSSTSDYIGYGNTVEGSDITDIFDDSIPMTEAAGIAWNFTGPDQGTKSENVSASLYMPGGHFLGITCFNSETNIKSCINLQRVCEMGANISQRREEVREIIKTDENGEEYKIKYRYFVPTGLISNEEINDDDFRTMFATMNSKRLLCEDNFVDEKTGYPFYRFTYLRNTGFGGELNTKITSDEVGYWNKQLTIEDEYDKFNGRIAKDVNYDDEETGETYTRTWEVAAYDYYRFRFGLIDLAEEEQVKKFLLWTGNDGGTEVVYNGGRRRGSGIYNNTTTTKKTDNEGGKTVALPQYENSFYFYFGLRAGATALDEFNKQFFANCETEKVIETNLTLGVKTEFDPCLLTSTAIVSGKDAVAPVTISYECLSDSTISGQTFSDVEVINGYYSYTIENLEIGEYLFKVVDGEGNYAERKVEIGGNSDVDAMVWSQGFNFNIISGMSASDISLCGLTYDCGYFSIENVSFNQNVFSGVPLVTIIDEDGNYYSNYDGEQPSEATTPLSNIQTATSIYDKFSGSSEEETGEDGVLLVFVWKTGNYRIYLWNNECERSASYYFGTYTMGGQPKFDLYLGNKEFNFSYADYLSHLNQNEKWWETISGDTEDSEGIYAENWLLRHFLSRRSVSGTPFTNNVFGLNENNVIINTALFGQPEKYDSTTEEYKLVNGVCYEDDHRYEGVVSDTTYIPTWPDDRRKLFGEMVVNGTKVASAPVITLRVVDLEEKYTSGNIHGFDVKDPENMFPDSEIADYVVSGDSGVYGYFIGRTDDGRIYYITFENNGERIFKYEGNRISAKTLTLYPVFYYPVMDREFDAKLDCLDWVNPIVVLDSGSDAESSDFNVKYEEEKFAFTVNGFNGLSYSGVMGNLNFGPYNYPKHVKRIEDNNDLTLPYAKSRYGRIGYLEPYSATTNCTFSLTEGAPSGLTFTPQLTTVGDSIETDMATYISYRPENDRVVFYNDINDEVNTYYLVKNSGLQCPLVSGETVSYPNPNLTSGTTFYLGRFGANSDNLLDVMKENNTYVQYPGQFVIIERTANGYKFPYKVNSMTAQSIVKEVTDSEADTNLRFGERIDAFDITLEKEYRLNPEVYDTSNPDNLDITPYVNMLIENIGSNVIKIDAFREELDLNVEDGDYVVCLVQSDKINLVRIYPKPINLGQYKENASEPYLRIIPPGTEGIYR